ncbi:MAG TPA: FKBP-type peptidyl-prolyl cis-trans isomerase [Flavipsychrobacter sp.]|nr:FKBP-type peptidyl-prolyl cis-trans isomerase [Flavipsychrobacter sp.]
MEFSLNFIITISTFAKTELMGIADKLFKMKADKAEANLKAGEEFLKTNAQKSGVVSLPSGLQYEIITEGTGEKPSAMSKVTCHYEGKLIDGTIFDSSVKRGQPASFPLNMVIKGWTEGLQLMSVGSKWRFFIPSQLGYGDRQVGAHIGPNSTLIFEVELLGIN